MGGSTLIRKTPLPGVYRDMPFAEYLSIPYPSASSIKIGHNVSMKHMRYAVDRKLEDKDTTAKKFGRALHAYILEPKRFKRDFKIAGTCEGKLSSGARKGELCGKQGNRCNEETGKWYCKTHGKGLEEADNTITAGALKEIEGAGKALESHPIINTLRQVGFAEYTVIAEVEGVLVKIRMDYYSLNYRGRKLIVDLKKIMVMKGSEHELQKTIRNYDYDLQAALYKDVHRQRSGMDADFLWIFVEDSGTHEVVPRYLSAPGETIGRAKYGSTLRRWAECVEHDRYPGYVTEPEEIYPSQFEMRQYGVSS